MTYRLDSISIRLTDDKEHLLMILKLLFQNMNLKTVKRIVICM